MPLYLSYYAIKELEIPEDVIRWIKNFPKSRRHKLDGHLKTTKIYQYHKITQNNGDFRAFRDRPEADLDAEYKQQ